MINRYVDVHIAFLCSNAYAAGEQGFFKNDKAPSASQLVFPLDNDLTAVFEDGSTFSVKANTLADASRYMGRSYTMQHDFLNLSVGINPKNDQLLEYIDLPPGEHEFTGTDKREVIVCLNSLILVNGIEFKPLEFAKIEKDKHLNIIVSNRSHAVILRRP